MRGSVTPAQSTIEASGTFGNDGVGARVSDLAPIPLPRKRNLGLSRADASIIGAAGDLLRGELVPFHRFVRGLRRFSAAPAEQVPGHFLRVEVEEMRVEL